MAKHPNAVQLTSWLDGGAAEIDEHVSSCAICAQTLGRLEDSQADLRPALLRLLQPPADLENRVSTELARRLQATADNELFSSLFGVALESGMVLFGGPETDRR